MPLILLQQENENVGTKLNLEVSLMDKKKAYLFCKYLHTEMKKIDEDKWLEGEKRNCDPGQEYIVDWINKNASEWRKNWEVSKCKNCAFWMQCGHYLKKDICDKFEFDENLRGIENEKDTH